MAIERDGICLRFCALAWLSTVALPACSSNAPIPSRAAQPPLSATASASKYIKHVVVIIQENRTFENFFAGYPGADAPMSGCAIPQSGGPPRKRSGCPQGDVLVRLARETFESNAPALPHDWGSSLTDWNGGRMDGFSKFGTSSGPYAAYSYIDRMQTRPYWAMAKQYVLADKMFPTEFGGSFTGHLTIVAGTDDIELPSKAEVDFPTASPYDCDSPGGTTTSYLEAQPYRKERYNGPFPCFDQFNTMAQVLDGAGIPWKFYSFIKLYAGIWEPFEAIKYVRYGSDWKNRIVAPQTKILSDAARGKLAPVSWVTPTEVDSDHPAARSDRGPSWVASVVNAIGESSYWPTSAIVVIWDDWGGFYDDAAPPQLDYRGLGIRIPCLIVSPYAKRGYVSHVQYEYGSILRFIEEANGLPAGSIGPTSQGYTDGRAASLDDAFDFNQKPRKFVKIPSKYSQGDFLREPPSHAPLDTQ
ncbi:MAG TPA: alkaline phosphatase family protein [Candidatus Nitrosotalea sp.]|nr:alkaline phosphatase family protein [Candidatus Nitrosotalea sp.]